MLKNKICNKKYVKNEKEMGFGPISTFFSLDFMELIDGDTFTRMNELVNVGLCTWFAFVGHEE